MHEFETFVYLDMEKTGSTFISQILNKFSVEKRRRQLHHRPMEADYDPTKFYFISVRNPLDAYLSLYSFGCQSQGKVMARMRNQGLGEFYDGTAEGFAGWLGYVLKPKNADTLRDGYHTIADGRIAQLLGLQSYRYLRLAVPGADELLADCRSEDDIRAIHSARKVPTFAVRYEWFLYDLCDLLSGPLRYAITDLDEALDYVRDARPVNTSDRVDGKAGFTLRKRLKRQMREREWLLSEAFDY